MPDSIRSILGFLVAVFVGALTYILVNQSLIQAINASAVTLCIAYGLTIGITLIMSAAYAWTQVAPLAPISRSMGRSPTAAFVRMFSSSLPWKNLILWVMTVLFSTVLMVTITPEMATAPKEDYMVIGLACAILAICAMFLSIKSSVRKMNL